MNRFGGFISDGDLPDVVGSAKDHSGFGVAGDANVGQPGAATGALEASVVPETIQGVEEEALEDLAATSGAGSDSLAVAALLLTSDHTGTTTSDHIAAVHVDAHVLLLWRLLLLHHVLLLLHDAGTELLLRLLLLLLLRRHLHVHHSVHRARAERHGRAVHHVICHHLTAGHMSIASHHRPLLLLLRFHRWSLRLKHGIPNWTSWLLLLLLLHTTEPVHTVDRSSWPSVLWLLLLLLGRRTRSRACVMLSVAAHITWKMGGHVIHWVHHLFLFFISRPRERGRNIRFCPKLALLV